MKPIYLDNHATTQVDPRVFEKMAPFFCNIYGNASSQDHSFGDLAANAVEDARLEVSKLVNVDKRNLHFCSGATEGINIGIKGFALQRFGQKGKIKIVVSPVEHQAVLATCLELSNLGIADLIFLRIDNKGRIDLDQVQELCKAGVDLLCVMAANNEIGNLYPITEICEIGRQSGVPLFCDASQAVGKIPFDFSAMGVSIAVFSGHKMYAPKGVGVMYCSSDVSLSRTIHGGGQEKGLRPGTLNVPAIVGFGEACRLISLEMAEDEHQVRMQRDHLEKALLTEIAGSIVNGDESARLPGNLNISFPGIPNSAVIARVRHLVAISSGSACTSGIDAPSHVLVAMHLEENRIESALRFGIGKFNTIKEVAMAADLVAKAVKDISILF